MVSIFVVGIVGAQNFMYKRWHSVDNMTSTYRHD